MGRGIGRLVAEAAGAVDGPQDAHQDAERADGLEAVGVGGHAAHGMEGDRIAGDGGVLVVPAVGPGDRQFDLLIARGHAHLVRQAADGRGRDAGDGRRPLRRAVLHPLLEELEAGLDRGAVLQGVAAHQARVGARGVGAARRLASRSHQSLFSRVDAPSSTSASTAMEEPVVVARRVVDHQFRGVAVLDQEVPVIEPELDQLVDDGEQQGAVGARLDRHPLVGDGRVAGADRD